MGEGKTAALLSGGTCGVNAAPPGAEFIERHNPIIGGTRKHSGQQGAAPGLFQSELGDSDRRRRDSIFIGLRGNGRQSHQGKRKRNTIEKKSLGSHQYDARVHQTGEEQMATNLKDE